MRRLLRVLLSIIGSTGAGCSSPRPPPVSADQISTYLDSLIQRGEAAYGRAEFDSARVLLRAALRPAEQAHDSVRQARVLTSLGLAAYNRGEFAEARILGEQALDLKLRAGLHADYFRSYNALGLLAWKEGRLNDAVQLYQQASEAARSQEDELGLAKAAHNLALVYAERGDFAQARVGFLAAWRTSHRLGDTLSEGRALNNLGMLLVQLGDPRAAIAALMEARLLHRAGGDRNGEQNALGQMGTAYDALGEPRLALAALDSALALSREQGLRQDEASNLELIAGLHRQAGDLQRALDLYSQANRINGELGLQQELGNNLRNAAELHSVLGRLDLAREKAGEALRTHRSIGARLQELRDLLLLADLAARAAEPAEAVEGHLRAADALARSLDARIARVELALTQATIADRRGQARAVLRVLRAARQDLARGGFGNEWQAAALQARAYARLGLLDSAAAAGRNAVAALERVRGEFGSSFLRTSYAADKAEPYGDLAEILLRLDRPAEAFEVADRARSHALLEHLSAIAEDAAPSRATVRSLADGEALLRRIDTLVSRLDVLEEAPLAERGTLIRSQARILATELVEARSAYETLLIQVAERDAAGTALLGGRNASSVEVQQMLLPDEALLEYLVTPKRVLAFVVTSSAVRSVVTEMPLPDLARRVRLARDLLGAPGAWTDGDSEVLGALHGGLIWPAEQAGLLRGVSRLIIVPHSVLAYLPFAALRREGTGRFLIEDYTLLHLPSAAALAVVRSTSLQPRASTRPEVFAPFSRTLPGSVREARAFQRVVPGSNAREGRRATEAQFRRALAGGGVIHLATHGVMNPRNPMFSRLEFEPGGDGPKDDGRLEVHELLALRIGAPLVFLSGCETGVGAAWSTQFAQGEDYATLAQAFLYAGARTVAATLWPISDEGAAVLAERFYVNLRSAGPAEALAAAQRELLKGAKYPSPYYWAGYQMIGDSEPLPGPHRSATQSVQRR